MLTLGQGRRVALAAQGFGRARPPGPVTTRQMRRCLDDMAVVQLDSVNVVCRSHYLPFLARLGPYDRDLLDRWLWRSRENFEYLAHEAAVTPLRHYPLLRHRMANGRWSLGKKMEREQAEYLHGVHATVVEAGPLTVKDLPDPGQRTGPWWGYGDGKIALEWLYVTGRLAIHERTKGFVTSYDLPERVIPAAVLAEDPVPVEEARRQLVLIGARHLGVATATDLADYFRIPIPAARALVTELCADGRLEAVSVQGWRERAFWLPGTVVPRKLAARALLSPFDPVVWCRPRAERLFGFHYRIEIYTPSPKRVHGYYVLPFLLGDRLVARVDVKADRQAGLLRVPGAFAEHHVDPGLVGPELAATLHELAGWLGLSGLDVGHRGDLAAVLRAQA